MKPLKLLLNKQAYFFSVWGEISQSWFENSFCVLRCWVATVAVCSLLGSSSRSLVDRGATLIPALSVYFWPVERKRSSINNSHLLLHQWALTIANTARWLAEPKPRLSLHQSARNIAILNSENYHKLSAEMVQINRQFFCSIYEIVFLDREIIAANQFKYSSEGEILISKFHNLKFFIF